MTKIAKTNAFKKLCIDFFVSFAPPSLKTRTAGYKLTKKSMQSFLKAFVFAIFVIFFLLILLFDSYTQPLLVLSAIPFSVIGVIWAYQHQTP
jgi:multidrug efflux pump subunit AcrB